MSGRPTAKQVAGWADEVTAVGERIGRRFARSEPRRRAVGYVRGLLSDAERKNGWQLAEYLGDPTPEGVQHLLVAVGGGLTTITNTTFSGNNAKANGGAINVNGTGKLVGTNLTVVLNVANSDNGGPLPGIGGGSSAFNYTTVILVNSLVAGNTRVSAPDTDEVSTSLAAGSVSNLIGGTNTAGGLTNGTNGNVVGGVTTANLGTVVNPTLANNGGPTLTHALTAGGPAVNAGTTAGVAVAAPDQRGFPFVRADAASGKVDIGAVEQQSLAMVVDSTADTADGVYTTNNFTLREAVGLANANPAADAIVFQAGLGGVVLTAAELLLTDTTGATTIAGPAAGTQVVTRSTAAGTPQFSIFNIATGVTAGLSGLTVSKGNTALNGGGVRNFGTLTVTNCTVSDNTSATSGGGIVNFGGSLTVTSCTLSGQHHDGKNRRRDFERQLRSARRQ